MRLAIVGPYPYDVSKINGGPEAATVYILEGLKQINDLDIQIIACRNDVVKEITVKKDDIVAHYLPAQKRFGDISLGVIGKYRVRKKIREIKPDIVHFQGTSSYAYIGSKPPCPTVTAVRGIIYRDVLFESGLTNFIRRYPQIYEEKIILRRVKHIICVSPYGEEAIRCLTTGKIYFIPNPVSDKYFNIPDNEVPNRIFYAACINKLKNALQLLKALSILKREIPMVELHIAGQIRDYDYNETLERYIEENNLESNVKYLGHLSEERLLKEYEECCVFALTSLQENSPFSVQQALAAGKPVVATRVGGVPYLVKDGERGFIVDCGDVETMAEKLRLLLTNKNLRKKFGTDAKQWALSNFKTRTIAEKTYEVYKEILEREKV